LGSIEVEFEILKETLFFLSYAVIFPFFGKESFYCVGRTFY